MAAILAVAEGRIDQGQGDLTFFDIGANVGLYSHVVASLFQAAEVHAFEPTPSSARIARRIATRNRLDLMLTEAAVGERPGRARLHLSATSDASNSLVEGFKKSIGEVEVEVITIDGHCEKHGVSPNLIKLDVESYEPEVLAGAARVIASSRPTIVIEVLARKGGDHGQAIAEAMAPYGYHYYQLTSPSTWVPSPTIVGQPRPDERDWLMTPDPLPPGFADSWQIWRDRLERCGPDKNPRTPLLGAVRVAHRRGGVREVVASARRNFLGRRTPAA